MKRILVFFLFMATAACTPSSGTATNESSPVVAKTGGASVPSNMRNAYIDPGLEYESSVILTLAKNNEFLLGKDPAPQEKTALAVWLKDRSWHFPPDRRFLYLKIDPSVDYRTLHEALEMFHQSDFHNLKLVVDQSEKPEANAVFDVKLPFVVHPDLPEKPYPLYLEARIEGDGKLSLNKEPQNLESLKTLLGNVFRERAERGAFREGTTEVERTVFVDAAPNVKYGEVVKLIDALKEAGASPLAFKLDGRVTEIKAFN